MKSLKPLLVFTFALLLLGFSAHKAYAHFPETQGTLTAILHSEPDDYPPAGKAEIIYFIFDDSANHFRLANCRCTLSIGYQGNDLYSTVVAPPATANTIYDTRGVPFTFANQGAYQITLYGTPVTGKPFKPFTLRWNFQAGPPSKPPATTSDATILKYFAVIIGVFLLLGLVLFAAF